MHRKDPDSMPDLAGATPGQWDLHALRRGRRSRAWISKSEFKPPPEKEVNYNNENNKLLSLFNVNFKGNIKNIKTSLDYNKAKTDQLIGDMLEKKMKKVIKDKLDDKFNNIIENLLE